MKLKFCGAARIVTGSCYLVETGRTSLLVDCGMFQGSKDINRLNYGDFPFDPKSIDYVILTHSHIDHCGLLPKLAAKGFSGQIFATPATADLCKVMLEDSADVQVRETEDENRRRVREGLPPRSPLYTKEEVQKACRLFKRVPYDKTYNLPDGISFKFRDAGHIVGSAIIELSAEGKRVVFSGDIGQWNSVIVNDPTLIDSADYLLIESTYGDRLHKDTGRNEELLLKYVKETYDKGGKLMIPSFALERTQEILYTINRLVTTKRFPKEPIFLDSPLAIRATDVFMKYASDFDSQARASKDPFGLKNVTFTPKVPDSIKLNTYDQPCVIMAGSGMCTGGRIRHHFRHGLWNPKNTVLFVGYQAAGTLGRYILEGSKEVRMMGMKVAVKADIRTIDGFSAHSDYNGLMRWIKGFKKRPKMVYIVHGEPEAAEAFKEKLEAEGFRCSVPSIKETVEM